MKERSADATCYLRCNDGIKSVVFEIDDLERVIPL